jgi:AAA15 family ATPase/GTPase
MILQYAADSELTKKLLPDPIRFKMGVNLVIGENGAGKSTLLRSIATAVGIDTGHYARSSGPAPARWYKEGYPQSYFESGASVYKADVMWTGSNVTYFDPGIYAGMPASLDGRGELESMSGIMKAMKGASGHNMIALLNALLKKKLEPNEDFLELARKERDGAATLNFIKWIEDKRKGDDVLWRVPVLLLDEPDNHLSYRNTKMLFTEFIPNLARVGFQVIVVSHSPFFPSDEKREHHSYWRS